MDRVLLADEDVELTDLLGEYLSDESYAVTTTSDGREAVEAALSNIVDLIVFDITMPRLNGIEVLRKIRSERQIPVLMLTARGDDVDRIAGLNLGADDYVSKPCSPGELEARVRAILRRTRQQSHAGPSDAIVAGDLVLHPGNRTAKWAGKPLKPPGRVQHSGGFGAPCRANRFETRHIQTSIRAAVDAV